MVKGKQPIGFWILLGLFLFMGQTPAAEPEKTPADLLRAIKQRAEELDKREKEVALKEQRLRILEREVLDRLNQVKKLREEIEKGDKAKKGAAEGKATAREKEQEERGEGSSSAVEEEQRVVSDKEKSKEEEQRNAQLARLAKLYELMPPAEAAARFQELDEALALSIISRMKAKKASKMLSVMDPLLAARYTQKMGVPLKSAFGAGRKE